MNPILESPISPSISVLGVSAATESMDYKVYSVRADKGIGYFKGLFTAIGLRNEQIFGIYPYVFSVYRVESVFSIDKRRCTACFLYFGDSVKGKRCFTDDSGP